MFYDVLLQLCHSCLFNHLTEPGTIEARVFAKRGISLRIAQSQKILEDFNMRLRLLIQSCVHIQMKRDLMSDVYRINKTYGYLEKDVRPQGGVIGRSNTLAMFSGL